MNRLYVLPSLVVLLITLVYALSLVNGVPLDDEWRWFAQLLLLKEEKISFLKYVTNEYSLLSHSQILAILFLWFDEKFLAADFAYFAYIGLVFYCAGFGLLSLYLKDASQQQSCVILTAASLISACGYFCTTTDFPWLLVVFEYIYYFFAILLLVAFDFYLKRKLSLALLVVCMVFDLLFADTIGMAAAFVVLSVFSLLCIFKQESFSKLGLLILAVVAVLVLEFLLLGRGAGIGGHSRGQTMLALLHHPADVILSFLSIFAQPLFDMTLFKAAFGDDKYRIFQIGFGLLMFQLVLATTIIWFKRGGYKITLLPILFVAFALLSWALILMSRYLDFGVYVMDAQRYVRNFTLIYVGLGLMFVFMKHDKLSKCLLAIAFVSVCGTYSAATIIQYKNKKYLDAYFNNAKVEMAKQPIDSTTLSQYIGRCDKGYCDKSINYLRENHLSIFNQQ